MRLNLNQTIFPSTGQKSIWHTFKFMFPFNEIVLNRTEKDESRNIIKGKKDFYEFMVK
jgi:hypothetical protein